MYFLHPPGTNAASTLAYCRASLTPFVMWLLYVSQTRSLGANEKRPTTYWIHSSVRLSFMQPLAEVRITHFPDNCLSSFILFTSLFPPLKTMNGLSLCPFALPARQTVTLSFSCPVDLMVTLDAPASFTVVALGISSQIGVSFMAITFAMAYCFVWNLPLTLRMKLITRSIRLPGSCCAREVRLRKVNPCLFIKRTTQPLLALKSCWDISSLSSEPAVTSVPFDNLSSRQMISPFLFMARLETRWPRALISWIHSSTLSSSSVEGGFLPPPCSLFLGFAEVSSSAFFWHHSRILFASRRNFRAAASLPLLSA